MRSSVRFAAAGLLPLAVAACGDKDSKSSSADSVRVGAVMTISGTLGSGASIEQQGIQLAVDEINAAGGVGGKPLEITFMDEESKAEKTLEAFQSLYAAGIKLVVGPGFSGGTLKATQEFGIANGMAVITYAATSPAITTLADNGLVNRTAPSDAFQGVVAASVAKNDYKAAKAAIIYLDNPYGNGLADAFEAEFKKLGGAVTTKKSYPELEDSQIATYDFSSLVTAMFTDAPDLIYLITYESDGAQLTKAMKAAYLAQTGAKPIIMGCDGNVAEGFIANADPDVIKGMVGTQPSPIETDPDYAGFLTRFKAKWNAEGGLYSSTAYDAVYLMALAIEAAGGSTEGTDVAPHIVASSTGGEKVKPTGWADAATKARAGTDIDFVGVSGPVDLDANGDPTSGSYEIWQEEAGKTKQVKVITYP